jgi:predicted alpha/beta hydrolase family esterase
MKVMIIHGSFGNPNEKWFPWLREQLEARDTTVFVPQFPSPPQQDLASWREAFAAYTELMDEDIIFVGHSLGPAFILSLLERAQRPIHACVFASGFVELLGNEKFDAVNRTFVEKTFDWKKIKENCGKFIILHGEDDPYVPLTAAQYLAKNVDTEVIVIPNGGHLNASAGFSAFPQLMKEMEKIL